MLISIIGTGRNGSSLLARMLDGSDDLFVHPVEERLITSFDDLIKRKKVSRNTQQNCRKNCVGDLEGDVSALLLEKYFHPSLRMLKNAHMNNSPITKNIDQFNISHHMEQNHYNISSFLPDYLKSLGRHILPNNEFKNYLFKTIETPYIDDYVKLFPDMKFIHLLRDPISVCSSQKRSIMHNKKHPASYLGGDWLDCMINKRWLPHARAIKKYQNSDNHILIQYEDLVKNPLKEVSRISEKFSLLMPNRPDFQTEFCDLDMDTIIYNPSKKGIKATNKVVNDFQKINNYDEILTQREIDLVKYLSRDFLSNFGYEYNGMINFYDLLSRSILLDRWDIKNCNTLKSILKLPAALVRRRKMLFSK
jgi:hypothetical protein